MTDVEFQDENNLPSSREYGAQGLYGFVIKTGLAKTEKEAGMILVGVAIAALIFALLAPFLIGASVKYTQPAPEQVERALSLPLKK